MFNQQVIDPSQQHGKMPTTQETESSDGHIPAVAQGERLVGQWRSLIVVALSPAAQDIGTIDETFALEYNILEVLTPEERVVPMAVTVVLIVGVVGLCLVIALCLCDGSSLQHSSFLQSQGRVTLQVNRITRVNPFCQDDHSPTLFGSLFDGSIDGGRVDMLPVTLGAEVLDVENRISRCRDSLD